MALLILIAAAALAVPLGEEPVHPYVASNANAGATPFAGDTLWRAFHTRAGVDRIVDGMVDRSVADPRIGDIFRNQDLVRLRRTLKEQFCYILGGGCDYTGRTMKAAHKDLGLQTADLGALIENLQAAMRAEGVPFTAQNRLLAKLAPMKREAIER
ncbi:group I truncated hemoglobin [Sphingomonas profundi]|uniref:group I truncated hemoglobin n=1 Tax=Alterirhizorhabdus profundi TaxID=2681549 RepID=UPI0012E8F2BD|nr:group 1 truncated hemoglobin [Sphingomonas profundi]